MSIFDLAVSKAQRLEKFLLIHADLWELDANSRSSENLVVLNNSELQVRAFAALLGFVE